MIAVTFLGATSRITVDLGDATILAQLPTADATALPAGSRVALTIRPTRCWCRPTPSWPLPAADEEA